MNRPSRVDLAWQGGEIYQGANEVQLWCIAWWRWGVMSPADVPPIHARGHWAPGPRDLRQITDARVAATRWKLSARMHSGRVGHLRKHFVTEGVLNR